MPVREVSVHVKRIRAVTRESAKTTILTFERVFRDHESDEKNKLQH